jgi:nitroreductase
MDEYLQNRAFWENNINTRRSVRSFERRAVEPAAMNKLKSFTASLRVPFGHDVEIRYFKSREAYPLANNLRKAPEDAIAFIAPTDLLSLAKTGFVGELALLCANGLGLSTCWFGHYILDEVELQLPDIDRVPAPRPKYGFGKEQAHGRYAIAISPLGYFKSEGLRPMDRLSASLLSYKRKPLDERLTGGVTETMLSDELRFAFDMARKAPSAANTQHWEFTLSDNRKEIAIAKPKGYRHIKWEHPDVCVGCCAAHFYLGLAMQGIACSVAPALDGDRVVWSFARYNG